MALCSINEVGGKMVLTTLKGMIIGAGLIIPIGAQNAYVLSQAIKRNYHFTAAFICIVL